MDIRIIRQIRDTKLRIQGFSEFRITRIIRGTRVLGIECLLKNSTKNKKKNIGPSTNKAIKDKIISNNRIIYSLLNFDI